MQPNWLPRKLEITGLSIEQNYRDLHAIFMRDLLDLNGITIDNKSVRIDLTKDKFYTEYERGFLHFVTRENGGQRIIDFERAERLNWVLPVLTHYLEPEVSCFWHIGPKDEALYLWLKDFDFLVILKNQKSNRYKDSRIIITSYHVDSGYRRILQKRLDNSSRIITK